MDISQTPFWMSVQKNNALASSGDQRHFATQSFIERALNRGSLSFDIETLGIDPSKGAMFEAALVRRVDQAVFRQMLGVPESLTLIDNSLPSTYIKPLIYSFENEGWKPLDYDDIPEEGKAFTFKEGSPFNLFPSDPDGERKSVEYFQAKGLDRKEFIDQLISNTKGKDVWIQNVNFESRFVASMMTYDEWQRFARNLETYSVYEEHPGSDTWTAHPSQRFYTTPRALNEVISKANLSAGKNIDSNLKNWADVYPVLKSELEKGNTGKTRIFDPQDLTRSMIAMAQQKGYMRKTGDVFTGASVETFSRYWLKTAEAHTAAQDARMQVQMAETYLGIADKLHQGTDLNEYEKNFFRYLDQIQPSLQKFNAKKTLLDAYVQIQQGGSYEAVTSSRTSNVKIFDNTTSEVYDHPISVSSRTKISNMDQVVSQIQKRNEIHGIEGVDIHAAWTEVQREFVEPLNFDLSRQGINYQSQRAMTEMRLHYQEYMQRLSSSQSGNFSYAIYDSVAVPSGLSRRNILKAGVLGLGLLAITDIADQNTRTFDDDEEAVIPSAPEGFYSAKPSKYSFGVNNLYGPLNYQVLGIAGLYEPPARHFISSSDDDYNMIEGLPHGGISQDMRRTLTPFGSGWRGLGLESLQSFLKASDAEEVSHLLIEADKSFDIMEEALDSEWLRRSIDPELHPLASSIENLKRGEYDESARYVVHANIPIDKTYKDVSRKTALNILEREKTESVEQAKSIFSNLVNIAKDPSIIAAPVRKNQLASANKAFIIQERADIGQDIFSIAQRPGGDPLYSPAYAAAYRDKWGAVLLDTTDPIINSPFLEDIIRHERAHLFYGNAEEKLLPRPIAEIMSDSVARHPIELRAKVMGEQLQKVPQIKYYYPESHVMNNGFQGQEAKFSRLYRVLEEGFQSKEFISYKNKIIDEGLPWREPVGNSLVVVARRARDIMHKTMHHSNVVRHNKKST